ncbi:adenylate/guanylate cyclase domain-containing protein [Shimia sp. R9_1]|uniref:adenylate/guanylate cyclase domain-containing protein n=1 Tax=Shimia sp. R9_1 TaxID=2821111 RepID=UPI001ADC15DA|nr:adenylate/guanylate cyclase domain-containing protein [Shimia sp. R9_1]MBO9408480.1 adenylate/guanylate cyclase domain-containing protein [Shimia sp. R9_1]
MSESGYVECDGLSIAYRSSGSGPLAILMVPGIFSHCELYHDFPQYSDFIARLTEFARVVEFDKRGQGFSDRLSAAPTLEERANDISALITALNLDDCVLFGLSEGAAMALLYAATHPSDISKVITFGAYAKACGSADYPHMPPADVRRAAIEHTLARWGTGETLGIFVPELAHSPAAQQLFGKIQRASCPPAAMRQYFDLNLQIDIRAILGLVQHPTLVLHHSTDQQVPIENSTYIAKQVPNARFEDCGPGGHFFWGNDNARIVATIRSFLMDRPMHQLDTQRVLATPLFADIVHSTEAAKAAGDHKWHVLLQKMEAQAAACIDLFGGRLIKFTGDGLLALFDAPGRAVDCALNLRKTLRALGLQSRIGLHTGEIELRGADIGGLAVHAAARIEALCQPGQILVSRTVTELTIGKTSLAFDPIGTHQLKGFDTPWPIFEVHQDPHYVSSTA